MKIIMTIFYSLILASCISKGTQNTQSDGDATDITISLLRISPPSVVIAPSATTQFSVVGGNAPYTYSISSGFGGITQSGLYTASASLGNNTIKVVDAGGNASFAIVTVGSSLQLSPATKTMGTSENFTFSAIGGVAPYTFSVISGAGSINPTTGEFTSDASAGTASIRVQDTNADVAYSTISVVNNLTVVPATITLEDNAAQTFTAVGGLAPYTYQVYAGNGAIDAAGNYTAPATAGTDIIRITDSNSIVVEATVTVALGPTIAVDDSNIAPAQTATVSTNSGTAPFTYTIESGSGSINSVTGEFTAPAVADLTTVRVTDANGFYQEATIQTYNLKKMALADAFTCMVHIQNDNTTSDFKCWGDRTSGRLGDEKVKLGDELSDMGDNLPILDFGAGNTPIYIYSGVYNHKCVLFSNQKVKCFGDGTGGKTILGTQNDYGNYSRQMGTFLPFAKLGSGITVDTVLPVENRLSLGTDHTCVAIDNDSIKCLGDGAQGRTGNGNQTDYCNGAANCSDNAPEIDLGVGKTIVQIASGHQHTCFLIAPDNQVKCSGDNAYGQLGVEDTTDVISTPNAIGSFVDLGTGRSATQIASGFFHTCALLDNSTVKCWGRNQAGQLGVGSTLNQGDEPLEMGDNLNIADMGTVSTPTKIYAGGYSSCALFANGLIKCWGDNPYGNLGYGSTADQGDAPGEMGDSLPFIDVGTGETVTSLAMGERTTCVITNTTELKCWGENTQGQLGAGHTNRIGNGAGEMGDNLVPVNLGTGKFATQVVVSRYSTCAILNDSTVKCFGQDESGSMGLANQAYGDDASEDLASLSNIDLGAGNYAKDVFAGRYHACALLMDDTMKCFGVGGNGRLGLGDTADRGDDVGEMGAGLPITDLGTGLFAIDIAGWENSTCVVLNTGDVKCFGDGANGRRGSGNQTDRGDGAGEMGDNLNIVDLGIGVSAKAVSKGNAFTCVINNSDKVKCWGYNNQGQLGIGNTNQKGHNGATVPTTYGDTEIGTGRTALKISLGHQHGCVLMDNDKVKCWGDGNYGQLGTGNQNDLGNEAAEMGDNLLEVDLGTGRTVKDIATGIYHSCAILDNDKVKCWGYNGYGQLGVGDTANYADAADETGDNLPYVILPVADKPVAIYAAGYHTCVVLKTNDIKCWGRNNTGQLGHGHRYDVGTDALSMGPNLPVTD